MTISKHRIDNALTIALEGRLDITNYADLESALKESLPGVTDLTFDLQKLGYISSAGLRVFLFAQKIRLIRDDHLSRSPLRGCARLE